MAATAAVGLLEAAIAKIITAEEIRSHSHGPDLRRNIERQHLLDFIEQFETVAALAVHLVDEGDDRDVTQPAHLEQLAGLALDALGGVDHHDGRVHRSQRAVGVFAEVLVARRVQQVAGVTVIVKGHHRAGDGDAAVLFDLHPVGPGAALVATGSHRACKPDCAAGEQ